jgi:hypothetical protein
MNNFSAISLLQEQVAFDGMIMKSALNNTNTHNGIFIFLAHWNKSPMIDNDIAEKLFIFGIKHQSLAQCLLNRLLATHLI